MASSSSNRDSEKASEVNDLEELQSEVNAMATKILEYRSDLPELLQSRFASLLEAHRPLISLPTLISSNAVVVKDGALNSMEVESDNEIAEKIDLLKKKMTNNASAIPTVLKRMNDCIDRVEKLEACNFTIHPVFKRKRID